MIRVAVAGACGRMGQEVVRTILGQPDMTLVGAIDHVHLGDDVGALVAGEDCGVKVVSSAEAALEGADVLVDFTRGDVAPATIATAIGLGVDSVVGTTGIAASALEGIEAAARDKGVSVFVAPNFALGAVLLMRFAREAARFYEWAEIIELHHEKKVDAPSGTALRTAELMAAEQRFAAVENETEKLAGARGAAHQNIRIHSVRLPGLVAHQEVILGGLGETLTLRHDSMSRSSFMPGVMLAVRRVHGHVGLTVGLEHLMGH